MLFFGWFSLRHPVYEHSAGLRARLTRFASARIGDGWSRTQYHGPGWGFYAAAPQPADWRWNLLAEGDGLIVASTALPVGLAPAGVANGPVDLGRAVLNGHLLDTEVVPPFGLVVIDVTGGRFALHQDWLGMARLYEYSAQGVIAFSNSPVMLPSVLGDRLIPDEDGWARYIGGGIFSGLTTPVRGVRRLPAATVRAGHHLPDHVWNVTSTTGRSVDDVLAGGIEPGDGGLDDVAAGLRRVGVSLGALWPGEIQLGLSGGKDSRLVAAALLASGVRPALFTRDDNPAETETAKGLVELVRRTRGIELEHRIVTPESPEQTHAASLRERAHQLFRRYDLEYGSSYLLRPAVGSEWADALGSPVVGGAAGGVATARWIPGTWPDVPGGVSRETLRAALWKALGSEVPPGWQTAETRRRLDLAIGELIDRGWTIGLNPAQTVQLAYLAERMRCWSTASRHVDQVTPLLTPEFVRASFAMSLSDRRRRSMHAELIAQLVPEWATIPFIANTAGLRPAQIPRIWDGDGVDVLQAIFARPSGPLLHLVDRAGVVGAFERVRRGVGVNRDDLALRNVVVLASAEDLFDEMNAETQRHVQATRRSATTRTTYQRARRRVAKAMPSPVVDVLLKARRGVC